MKRALLQALKLVASMRTRFILLTRGAHGPAPAGMGGTAGRAGASNGGVWGLARVTRVEMPSANVDSIDVLPSPQHSLRAFIGAMEATPTLRGSCELASRGTRQFEVRLRRGATVKAKQIKPKGVSGSEVVITGGLGGLGLHTTPWLLARSAQCVILTSRSGQVARDGQGLGDQLKALQARRGNSVLVRVSDAGIVADADALFRDRPLISAFMHAPHE